MITTHTILIVDDNINNLKVAVTHLRAYSYKILVASTGIDGVARAQLTQPDLILLDLMMPDIDGFEVCARLKANPTTADIPVIFMTAVTDMSHKTRGLKEGAVDYITKPVDATELLLRVKTHLELRELRLKLERKVKEHSSTLEKIKAELERIHTEKERLYEALASQTGQLNQLAHQTMREQLQGDKVVQLFLQSSLQPHINHTLNHIQKIKYALQESYLPAFTAVERPLDEVIHSLVELSQEISHVEVDRESLSPLTLQQLQQKLSEREYQTLKMLAHGISNREIASEMGVTPATVTTYRRRIMQKLDIDEGHALMQLAFRLKLHDEPL